MNLKKIVLGSLSTFFHLAYCLNAEPNKMNKNQIQQKNPQKRTMMQHQVKMETEMKMEKKMKCKKNKKTNNDMRKLCPNKYWQSFYIVSNNQLKSKYDF
ncbi:hypothetical protein [Metabacillus arenae]|uniref:Uncharacterized protein n=1 Tax=Metabacillus arenae TaxID=2771434 RepID=A0A926S2X7_9BACI|nr:hypothetical protein [Metabacillus arenae]MBD1382414.1 hypothetical protein [Metabacillus arenae]